MYLIPPELKVLNVERKKYKLKDKVLLADVTLQIINKGRNVDIELHDIEYDLKIKNTLSATGIFKNRISMKPGSTKILIIPISIQLEHPLKTALMVINDNDKMRYELYMKSSIKENSFDKKGKLIPVEVRATGIMELKK